MLDFDNHGFTLILHEEDLKKIIHDGSQNIVNQTYSLNLPILGSALAQTTYIRSTKVQLANDQIYYNLEAGLEIRPKSGLLPNVFGIVQVESSFRLDIDDSPKVDFKILNFEWLEGPSSSKGKPLKFIKRLSTQLAKGSDVIASMVERKISKKLTSEEIENLIANHISTLRIANLPMYIKSLSVRFARISIKPSHLSLYIGYSLRISYEVCPFDVKVCFGEIDTIPAPTLTISEKFINKVLQVNLGKINVLLSSSPVKIQDLSLEIKPQMVKTSIIPKRFTEKPIELLLRLMYQPELRMIELLDCQISANEEAGMIIRGIFKLVSGKLKDTIEKYFPLDPAEKLKVLMDSIPDSGPFAVHFDHLKFLDIQFLEGKLCLVLEYLMQLEAGKSLPYQ
ncbi:MAG: hypothetical protein IPL46_32855 [Saprospiraceae bacterium]|nr:hypothetical protein [Saprospiraceae bacterium]